MIIKKISFFFLGSFFLFSSVSFAGRVKPPAPEAKTEDSHEAFKKLLSRVNNLPRDSVEEPQPKDGKKHKPCVSQSQVYVIEKVSTWQLLETQ